MLSPCSKKCCLLCRSCLAVTFVSCKSCSESNCICLVYKGKGEEAQIVSKVCNTFVNLASLEAFNFLEYEIYYLAPNKGFKDLT